jgi:hypothetical protein
MTLTGKEAPELSTEHAALSGVSAALTWQNPREKPPDPIQWAPGMAVYPMEIAGIIDVVKSGQQHTISPDIELVCAEISDLSEEWAGNVTVALVASEEPLEVEPKVASWM